MSDQIFCPAQTFRGNRFEPSEFCEEEVAQEGDLCDRHEEDDRADELYDQYMDDKYEREHYPEDFTTDYGD